MPGYSLPRSHCLAVLCLTAVIYTQPARAHDPVFGLGPHVLYKGGVEIAPALHWKKQGADQEGEAALELTYGLSGDWAAGFDLPYVRNDDGIDQSDGLGNLSLFTKYRFWRHDRLGVQESAAVLLKVKTDTGSGKPAPAITTGSTDAILGLSYGYESRRWYRWTSLRYRRNGENDTGLRRGDKLLFDVVGGIRLQQTRYLEPDTVWLLELNGEYGRRAELNGQELANTGGSEWFLSPGIFWTERNFAIKAGVQIPVSSHLNGNQATTDYRTRLVFEWHL